MAKLSLVSSKNNGVKIISTPQPSTFVQSNTKMTASTKNNGWKSRILNTPNYTPQGSTSNRNTLLSSRKNAGAGSNVGTSRGGKISLLNSNGMQSNGMQSISNAIRSNAIQTNGLQSNAVLHVQKIDIFTTGNTAKLAQAVAAVLINCGVTVNIFMRYINKADIAVCTREKGRYLWIFAPQILLQSKNAPPSLPAKKYFLYQFENLQTKNPRILNSYILEVINNAKHTFECSPANLGYYPSESRGRVSLLHPNSAKDIMQQSVTINLLYPALFHKYVLGLRNPNENLLLKNYSISREAAITRKNICHIHCLYLKNLDTMFGDYISRLMQIFDIIVTYTHTADYVFNKYTNITFLYVNNYGMDIGPKFTVYAYLLKKNIDYNYIFYMHSKSNDALRQSYLIPFINNLTSINKKINENNANVACYFHNVLWLGDSFHSTANNWHTNKLYMNDILNYLNIKHSKQNTMFSEGNFYILHKHIINKLFSDKFLYNILNSGASFDFNWVKKYYSLHNEAVDDIYKVYRIYKEKHLCGNNICTNKGHNGLADAMIEHIFERLPITLCKEYGISINILDNTTNKTIHTGLQKQIIQTQFNITPLLIAPEHIIHTGLNTATKTLCIVACHTSSDLKIKCLLKNIHYFEEIANDIVYINSTEFKRQNIIANMVYIPNDKTVCYGKYLHVLQNMDISQYDNVILTNDSYVITKSLARFKNLFNASVEMTALNCSNQISKHYPDWLRRYNKAGINKLIEFYKNNLTNYKSFQSLIQNIEVKCHVIHKNSINVLYDAIPGYTGNIHFDNTQLKDYLYNKNYPIIKIKKLQFTTYNNRQLPSDFNSAEYKSLHPDLSELSANDAISHFINHGMAEGRTYKKQGQPLIYPSFLTQYLNECNFYM